MPLFNKKASRNSGGSKEGTRKFIDLNDYKFPAETVDSRNVVKVAEISELDDLRKISELIYENNIVILDCSSISGDDFSMTRVKDELKRAVKDISGDLAAISNSYLLVTPPGISIDRRRVR